MTTQTHPGENTLTGVTRRHRRTKWHLIFDVWLRRLHLIVDARARRRSAGARKAWITRKSRQGSDEKGMLSEVLRIRYEPGGTFNIDGSAASRATTPETTDAGVP